VASPAYSVEGSTAAIAGVSSLASPEEVVKSGYVAQLYNMTGMVVTAPADSVNVGQTFQLGAIGILDDGTVLVLNPATVAWSMGYGPITSISTSGIATSGAIFANTAAEVSGSLDGCVSSLGLTVYNAGFDAWQLQYFGSNNPLSAPGADADGTGQTNALKYLAGLDPVDPRSRFIVATGSGNDLPGQMSFVFSPVAPGRTYVVQYCTDLVSANWQTLPGATESTEGNAILVIDPDASGPRKFYRVQISY
jgi:hypothetical protein